MPWRDEALVLFGESARDLARHFIQVDFFCFLKHSLSLSLFIKFFLFSDGINAK
jgi:hypothetical protein